MNFDARFFYVLALVVFCGGYAAREFYRLWKLMKLARNENLFGNLGERFRIFMTNAVAQKKMFKDPLPGLFHMFIFFGFIVITLGSGEHVVEAFWRGFSFEPVFGSTLYGWLTMLQDVFFYLIMAAVVFFGVRRLITKPRRLPHSGPFHRDGLIVLAFTGTHILAEIVMYAYFIAAGDPHGHAHWHPITSKLGAMLAETGITPEACTQIAWAAWCVHVGSVFAFAMYIPHSKHLHIVTAGPNIFFARLKAKGTFSQINFEDTEQTSFGVGKVTDFTWKDVLDTYSCTTCGRCNEFCPTTITGKPLRPMELIQNIKKHLKQVGPELEKDKTAEPSVPLISEASGITFETVWACTTCRACVEACPVMIEHVDKIVDMRRNLVLMQGSMPAELQNTMKNWETQSNPWGIAPDSRDEWARGLEIPRYADKPDAEYLFYVGCAGSFNARNQKITTAFAKILKKANVDFAILGKEELCNGETARRAGNEYLAKAMIDMNIEVLKRYNVKKILTTCPHCFNTLMNEYPDFGFKAEEVIHHSEFIDRLIKAGKVTPQADGKNGELRVAFHDSCYLGRYNDVYDAPRDALKSVPGVQLVEMPRSKTKGLCCGAGGARMWMEETIGKRINVERVEEALELKPDVVAAGCPYCQVMLTDGVDGKGVSDKVKVLDIAEMIADRI